MYVYLYTVRVLVFGESNTSSTSTTVDTHRHNTDSNQGNMSDWARGGHATQAANSLADFADFISSAYGPGAPIFAQAFDAQLRGTGVDGFKSATPAKFEEWHVGAVWAEIDKSTDVDFSSLTIGRQVYLGASTDAGPIAAAKASWWSKDGAKARDKQVEDSII